MDEPADAFDMSDVPCHNCGKTLGRWWKTIYDEVAERQ